MLPLGLRSPQPLLGSPRKASPGSSPSASPWIAPATSPQPSPNIGAAAALVSRPEAATMAHSASTGADGSNCRYRSTSCSWPGPLHDGYYAPSMFEVLDSVETALTQNPQERRAAAGDLAAAPRQLQLALPAFAHRSSNEGLLSATSAMSLSSDSGGCVQATAAANTIGSLSITQRACELQRLQSPFDLDEGGMSGWTPQGWASHDSPTLAQHRRGLPGAAAQAAPRAVSVASSSASAVASASAAAGRRAWPASLGIRPAPPASSLLDGPLSEVAPSAPPRRSREFDVFGTEELRGPQQTATWGSPPRGLEEIDDVISLLVHRRKPSGE